MVKASTGFKHPKAMKKLAVFDLDSTLLDGESINIVLEQIITDKKKLKQLETVRAQGMRGELALDCSLKQRIVFFEGFKLSQLQHICQTIPWTNGTKETIQQLKKSGYLTLCLSSSFRTIARRTITELGMDAYCSNTLEHRHGILTGKINGKMMYHQSKGEALKKIQTELGIGSKNTLVVGDGANDLSMFPFAEISVAFGMNDELSKEASHIVMEKNLSNILGLINVKNHNYFLKKNLLV